jgi:heme/copper-type cytochrome/quinol oxidase subunit 2
LRLIRANGWAIFGLILIGLTLAIVAVAINAVLGFQVLWAIADSQNAMTRLGISPAVFTVTRAILAVVVFVMISFVRAKARSNEAVQQSKPASKVQSSRVAKITVVPSNPVAIPQVPSSFETSMDGLVKASTFTKYDLIKAVMARRLASGESLIYKLVANEAGAGESTVKLYAKQIKEELGIN